MSERCEICRGARVVRLPRYRLVQVRSTGEILLDPAELSYLEIPCPECAPSVAEERVAIVEVGVEIALPYAADSRLVEHTKDHAAHMLADALKRDGFIRFEMGEADTREMRTPMRATLGVVAPKAVGSIEERVLTGLHKFGQAILDAATSGINVWGSAYGDNSLLKSRAVDAVRDAIRAVLAPHRKDV